MIKSMTGFASLTRDDETATITVTVKSVNHRFLDLQLRVPSSFGGLEARIRSIVQERVTRGLTTAECQQYLHTDTCPGA